MRLFISTLAPAKCGVAAYAEEHLAVIRKNGVYPTTASPNSESNCDIQINSTTLTGAFKWFLFCLFHRFEHVDLHYVDNHYFRGDSGGPVWRWTLRWVQCLSLRVLVNKADTSTIIVHELPHHGHFPLTFTILRNIVFSAFTESNFHTCSMRESCVKTFRGFKAGHIRIIDHSRFMRRKFNGSSHEAREILSLDQKSTIFLCIGFIQASKGFDDALEAFIQANVGSFCQLHIVGSVRSSDLEDQAYCRLIGSKASKSVSVFLHDHYVSEEDFDTWIQASDVVILPYLGVASSGVGARAQIYSKLLIVRNLPNLVEQFPEARLFETIDDLSGIIAGLSRKYP